MADDFVTRLMRLWTEPLPAVTNTEAALAPGAPLVWPDAPNNICYVWLGGDKAATMTQTAYRPWMIAHFNLGGHFGCVHRVFVSENIGPLIWSSDRSL